MFLSRLLFYRRGLTTAVLRNFGKVPERNQEFTTSRRSASKQFNTILKKEVGSVLRAQVDVLRCCNVASKILPLISSKRQTFSGRGLICLATVPHKDMLITYLMLLIFSEKE